MIFTIIFQIFSAAIVAAAFGVLFNVRGKNLFFIGLNGFLGYLVYSVAVHYGYESYIGMFFASLIMAVYSEMAARFRKAPASTFLVAALIPIVPGGGMFRSVLILLQGDFAYAGIIALNTVLEAGAIAISIIIVSSVITLHPPIQSNDTPR